MFEELKKEIENCRFCEESFGFIPHPIFWGNKNARIAQISQAPSLSVHNSGKPFTDMSGKTLREWYQIKEDIFYNKDNFFIGAIAHCYPGKDKKGNDKKPPKCCFNKWVNKELKLLNNEIYIIIGAASAKIFFPNEAFETLVFKNNYWNNKLALVIPHPSPLNRRWIKAHSEFMSKRIYEIRDIINSVLNK